MSIPVSQFFPPQYALTSAGIFLLSVIPWLNPLSPSPTASVSPLLVSWTCAAVLLLLQQGFSRLPLRGWAAGSLVLLFAAAALGNTGAPPGPEGLALLMSLLVIWACAVRFSLAKPADATVLARAFLLAGLASVVMAGLQYFDATEALTPWVSAARPGEAFGNLRQRNLYASLTSIALCALLWLARCDPWFNRPMRVMGPAVLLATGNALSHSRTGLFELLLILCLAWPWGLFRERRALWALAPVLPAYLACALGLPVLFSTVVSQGIFTRLIDGAPECSSRVTLWSNVIELIGQKPWFGWGWGQLDYAHYMTLYNGPRFCDILDNAHNLPLHLAVELGVPVTLLVCGTVCWTVWRARPWADADPGRQLAWGVLAVIGLHSLLEYPLWYGPFQMAFGISLGLLSSSRLAPTTRHTQQAFPAGWKAGAERNAPLLLATVILAGVAGAAWDYHRMRQIYLPPDERMTTYREDTLTRVRAAWLFRDQVRFAELTLTPLTPDNAAWTLSTATTLLRFSPEPRVIEKVIESAALLGQNDLALQHLVRYQAAFPKDHAQWAGALAPTPVLTGPGG